MRTLVSIIIILLSFGIKSKSQNLENYLQEGAENNPQLKADYAEFEAALQKISQARAFPDPNLSFGYFINEVETRVGPQKAKISISQMIPWFGILKAQEDIAALMAAMKFEKFVQTKNELFKQIKLAYYPLYELNEKIKIQEQNLEILKTYKKLAITSFSNAKGSMVNVIRVDLMLEDASTDLQLLKDFFPSLNYSFNKLLNSKEGSVIVSDSLMIFETAKRFVKDSMVNNNPMLKALDIKSKAAEKKKELAKKKGLPKVGLGLDYVFINERTDMEVYDNGKNAIMPMVSVSLPIFRGKYKAAVMEAKFQQEAISYRKQEVENKLLSSYETAYYQMNKSKQLAALYDNQIIKTQQAIDLLHKAYSNTGSDFEEVLSMQRRLLKYEMAKATSIKDFYLALAQLDYLTAKQESYEINK